MQQSIQHKLKQTHAAAIQLQQLKTVVINKLLNDFSTALLQQAASIIKANKKDVAKMELINPLYDRLLLTEERLTSIVRSIKKITKLQDPAGKILEQKKLPNGIQLQKITTPLGVVAAIFESRPNVVADIAALCLKSRNACVLKGSRDADNTNKAIVKIIHSVLKANQLPTELVLLLPPQREIVNELFTATKYIDVIIPRGSNSLIQFVRKNSLVPVIETGAGVCHVYVHKDANLQMATNIVFNAKTSRPSVCNAMDTVIVDEKIAKKFLSGLASIIKEKKVIVYADKKAYPLLKNYPFLFKASKEDFYREFLSLTCAVKIVKNETEAMIHIAEHGTKHSEAIVTDNKKIAEQFLQLVDAASVYHNASTRFTDGEEFGLGAEVGIATQKLHARGPFALEKLVTEKWVLRGKGQIR
jgi:glutamate-5-semialdehyde dehydrogenase